MRERGIGEDLCRGNGLATTTIFAKSPSCLIRPLPGRAELTGSLADDFLGSLFRLGLAFAERKQVRTFTATASFDHLSAIRTTGLDDFLLQIPDALRCKFFAAKKPRLLD
jgi:hypothetical protein